jgi:hypothetical protein
MSILQGWVLGFNPNNPKGMKRTKILTWITLWKLPVEFLIVEWETTSSVGGLFNFNNDIIQRLEQ